LGAVPDPLLRQVRCAAIKIFHLKGEARQVRRRLAPSGVGAEGVISARSN
jgi:hypothetical protein